MSDRSYYSREIHGSYEIFELGDFDLESGYRLRGAKLAYRTIGTLSPAKDNAILFPTWYSGTSGIIEQAYVGCGRALNPEKYFIIIANQIGNGLSTSPSNSVPPARGPGFPVVTIADDVVAQHKLVTEQFGLSKLELVLGGSMGAQQTYEWAVRYPDIVRRAA
ncbi:MAG: alpha/beta fold hydrolase, partial [Proteobacteria bacterium]|nr:alpha/beta fold hydrolase [Pseudomonadota bacterium]